MKIEWQNKENNIKYQASASSVFYVLSSSYKSILLLEYEEKYILQSFINKILIAAFNEINLSR